MPKRMVKIAISGQRLAATEPAAVIYRPSGKHSGLTGSCDHTGDASLGEAPRGTHDARHLSIIAHSHRRISVKSQIRIILIWWIQSKIGFLSPHWELQFYKDELIFKIMLFKLLLYSVDVENFSAETYIRSKIHKPRNSIWVHYVWLMIILHLIILWYYIRKMI